MRSLAALLLLAGCVFMQPGRPVDMFDQEEAIAVVWHDSYARADEPPTVRWVTGRELVCVVQSNGKPGFLTPVGCREGLCLLPTVVSVAWHDGDIYSGTTLAHEMEHAAQAREGVIDPGHHTAPFQPGGAVDLANVALAEAGL